MDGVRLMLAGDVMTGRGIDQAMAHPLPPQLHEPWVHDAREYLRLAERVHGAVPRPVPPDYVWGEALAEMERAAPALRIVNLETAVTTADRPWPGKRIHYRMNPAHVACLSAARLDACVLANNHVLDWGVPGLLQTLEVLHRAGLRTAGAGTDPDAARAPAVLPMAGGGRVLLFAWATPSSGVLPEWEARADRPGVALLAQPDEEAARTVAEAVARERRAGDLVVVSLHWGGNWVPAIPAAHRAFAHRLIELGAADLVHGHSSHHPLPVEVHHGRLILYGCGDLINDYEGIRSPPGFRCDLGCLYFATLDRDDGRLRRLEIVPLQRRRLRLSVPPPDALGEWERAVLSSGMGPGTRLERGPGRSWVLRETD